MTVEIYSKPNCPLCEDVKTILERVRTRVEFNLVEVDISRDPALRRQFRYDIPVVFIDGQQAFKHRVTEEALEARLREGGAGGT